MENGPFEDIFPIKNGSFPSSHVSLSEGIPKTTNFSRPPSRISDQHILGKAEKSSTQICKPPVASSNLPLFFNSWDARPRPSIASGTTHVPSPEVASFSSDFRSTFKQTANFKFWGGWGDVYWLFILKKKLRAFFSWGFIFLGFMRSFNHIWYMVYSGWVNFYYIHGLQSQLSLQFRQVTVSPYLADRNCCEWPKQLGDFPMIFHVRSWNTLWLSFGFFRKYPCNSIDILLVH